MNTAKDIYLLVAKQMPLEYVMLFCLGLVFLAEELLIRLSVGYPYKYGLIVRRVALSAPEVSHLLSRPFDFGRAAVKVPESGEHVYFHARHPFPVLGPLIFAGQISPKAPQSLNVRMGVGTFFFLMYIFVWPLATKPISLYSAIDTMVLAGLLYWFYLRLLSSINQPI